MVLKKELTIALPYLGKLSFGLRRRLRGTENCSSGWVVKIKWGPNPSIGYLQNEEHKLNEKRWV